MTQQHKILWGLIGAELRAQRRSPVWIMGLAAAALLGFTELYSAGGLGWPTANAAFRSYQLSNSVIFGVMVFLLTAGSLSKDLAESRRELVLSRPVNLWVYLGGKVAGNVLLTLGVSLMLLAAFLVVPFLHGASTPYPLSLFIRGILLLLIPSVLFCAGLAAGLMCLTRRVIIALPVFLVYFLAVAMFRNPNARGADSPPVDLWDFSMRMEPEFLNVEVGLSRIQAISFSHLLNPPLPALYARAGLYTILALALVAIAGWLLKRLRSE